MIEAFAKSIRPRTDLTAAQKWVLHVLAEEQGGRSYCKLSRKQIGDRCGLSEATVKRAVLDLKVRGLITIRRSRLAPDLNDMNCYSVVWVNNFNRKRNWLRRERAKESVAS